MATERGSEIPDGSQLWGKELQGLPAHCPHSEPKTGLPTRQGPALGQPRGRGSLLGLLRTPPVPTELLSLRLSTY